MYCLLFLFSVEPVVDIGITWMTRGNLRRQQTEAKRKEQQLHIELDALTTKRKTLEKTAATLLCDADKKAKLAENKQDFTMLASSSAVRLKAKKISEKELPECINMIDYLT